MNRTTSSVLAVLVLSLVACGGGKSGFIIPQESELKPFVAPETSALLDDGDEISDEALEDYEDYEDDGDADDETEDAASAKSPSEPDTAASKAPAKPKGKAK